MSSAAQAAFTVDDLPRFSPWPARLLGLTEWQPRRKTPAEVTREFDRDKWGELLERLGKAAPGSDLEALEGWLRESEEPSLCSVGQHFELLPPRESLRRHYQLVADTLSVLLPASGVVELGAGYGFTTGSDRFVLKAILGYAFPIADKSNQSDQQASSLKMGTGSRYPQNSSPYGNGF